MKTPIHTFNRPKDTNLKDLSSTDTGSVLLEDLQEKLQLAGDELRRMEDEGGITLNKTQNIEVAVFERVTKRINRVLQEHGLEINKQES